MIPSLIDLTGAPWSVLPSGVHQAGLDEVEAAFATNVRRRGLFGGLVDGAGRLQSAGCLTIYLDGSFVTGKPQPNDFDACWDPTGVDEGKLDAIFLNFKNSRAAQKAALKGEFFPSSMICADVGQTFLEFFQVERFTGKEKGIISISLAGDPILSRRILP